MGICIDKKYIMSQPPLHQTWEKLESFVEKRLCKVISVSNLNSQLLFDLLSSCKIKRVAI